MVLIVIVSLLGVCFYRSDLRRLSKTYIGKNLSEEDKTAIVERWYHFRDAIIIRKNSSKYEEWDIGSNVFGEDTCSNDNAIPYYHDKLDFEPWKDWHGTSPSTEQNLVINPILEIRVPTTGIDNWNVEEFAQFLEKHGEGFHEYADMAREDGVSGGMVVEYESTHALLDDLGVDRNEHRHILTEHLTSCIEKCNDGREESDSGIQFV